MTYAIKNKLAQRPQDEVAKDEALQYYEVYDHLPEPDIESLTLTTKKGNPRIHDKAFEFLIYEGYTVKLASIQAGKLYITFIRKRTD